jgi:hypothetical protein
MGIVNRNTLSALRRPFLLTGSRLGLGLALSLTLSSCVYVPVVDEPDAASASCKTYTKTMSLNAIEVKGNINIGIQPGCNRDCAAVALAPVIVVTAGSALISGSIVLTGNTIHWLEYQGTCSDGYLNKTKQLFLDTIGMGKVKPTEAATEKQN